MRPPHKATLSHFNFALPVQSKNTMRDPYATELVERIEKLPPIFFMGPGSSGKSPCYRLLPQAACHTGFQRPFAEKVHVTSKRCSSCYARDVVTAVTAYSASIEPSTISGPPLCWMCLGEAKL